MGEEAVAAPPKDLPTTLLDAKNLKTVQIDAAAGTNTVIFTPDGSRVFRVHYVFCRGDGVAGSFEFLSGTNELSGEIPLRSGTGSEASLELFAGGIPLFVGQAQGEAFEITTVGTPADGFCVVSQIEMEM